jgi:hypothetical protein
MDEASHTISGVTVPESLLTIQNVQWFERAGKWLLTTWQGRVIGSFDSEDEVTQWWVEFQQFPARIDALATKRRVTPQAAKSAPRIPAQKPTKRKRSRPSYGPPIKDDPLMPWNKEFDMPEFDAS